MKQIVTRDLLRKNQSIVVRIYYCKNEIISGLLSASLTIYMRDIYGRMWQQPLFAPGKDIENSTLVNEKEYKDRVDEKAAIECFCGKSPW